MTTAIYVRTSTDDNEGRAQLHELGKICKARWNISVDQMPLDDGGPCPEIGWLFIDRGESGAKASRPAWDRLMRDVRAGTVKRIVCTELSRLGRKLGNLVLVLDELHALGCEVVIVREGIDYTTPAGRMFAQILGALAEFERERIGERIRSGVLRAKEKGTRSGKLIGGQLREFDLQRAIELRTNGASWRTIAQAVGCPTVTVRRRVQAHWDEFRGVPRTTPQKEADSA